jgi:hypothetical protein
MSVASQILDPQSASLALTLLQSKAGNRWARAVDEMKTNRLHVSGDFPEFIVTNKSGVAYKVRLDMHGIGSCTCPDFQVRIAQEGRMQAHCRGSDHLDGTAGRHFVVFEWQRGCSGERKRLCGSESAHLSHPAQRPDGRQGWRAG